MAKVTKPAAGGGEALPETTFEDALKLEREQLVARAAAVRGDDAKKAYLDGRVKQVDAQLKLHGAPVGRRAQGDQVTG